MANWEGIVSEVVYSAVRSRGPGGQNVNKVSSSAVLYWNFALSFCVSEFEKTLILQNLKNLITKSGEIIIRSDEYRDLPRNKDRCLEKLLAHLERALYQPKVRKKTRPTKSSKIKNKEKKIHRGRTKSLRKRVDF